MDGGGNAWSLTVEEYDALGSLQLSSGSFVSLEDDAAKLAVLDFARIGLRNVSGLDVKNGSVLTLNTAQAIAYADSTLITTNGDYVKVVDTKDAVSALTAAQLTTFRGKNIESIDLRANPDNPGNFELGWRTDQATAFANSAVKMVAGDRVRVFGSADDFKNLSTAVVKNLAAATAFILESDSRRADPQPRSVRRVQRQQLPRTGQ